MSVENFKTATYEEKMKMLYSNMTEKQQKNSREQVLYMCRDYCGKCPSHEGTGEGLKYAKLSKQAFD